VIKGREEARLLNCSAIDFDNRIVANLRLVELVKLLLVATEMWKRRLRKILQRQGRIYGGSPRMEIIHCSLVSLNVFVRNSMKN
jgi:hypothetical protein